jgi:hypothetical protein
MINLTLQASEAENLERLLDLILKSEAAAKAVFEDGAQRRDAQRVSKKLYWVKQKAVRCKAD